MQTVDPHFLGTNKGHYCPGMLSNGTLYISGQLSIDMDTREVPAPDVRLHATLALHNMERVLRAAGLRRENVVQCRIYVTDMDAWDAVNEVYAAFFGAHKPARCVVNVPKLHFGCLVEVEAVAECGRATHVCPIAATDGEQAEQAGMGGAPYEAL